MPVCQKLERHACGTRHLGYSDHPIRSRAHGRISDWRLELPPGERLRVLRGCDRSSAICTLAVSPRCDGDTRVYRVHVRNNGVSKTITATVPRADCQTPSPTPTPQPPGHPECAGAERGKLCNFQPGALQADECDGNGHCVDCSDGRTRSDECLQLPWLRHTHSL